MKTSQRGLALIMECEGYHRALPDGSCTAYQEEINGKLDVPTIGFGCTKNVKMGMVWTRAQAEAALMEELEKHEARVQRLVTVELNQHQFDALVSFDFNTGGLTLDSGQPSTALKLLNAGKLDEVPAALSAWNKFNGKVSKGLVSRRAAEVALWLAPVTAVDASYMPQAAAEAPAPAKKSTVATIAATAGGGAALSAPSLIPSPDVAVGAVTSLTAYHTLGSKLLGLATLQNGILLAIGGTAYLLVAIVLPRLGIGRAS